MRIPGLEKYQGRNPNGYYAVQRLYRREGRRPPRDRHSGPPEHRNGTPPDVQLVVGVLGAGGFYLRSGRTPKLTDKDTVVLSEFDNRTGDPIFDVTLKPALAIDLEQTPFLSLLPDQRVRSTLKCP